VSAVSIPGRIRRLAAAGSIALAVLAAYAGIYSAPFVYLDLAAIRDNPTIRHLWPLWSALWPSRSPGLTVEGRPILNLSLALNYALSGTRVWSYHLVNVLIHLAAALTLWGIVRRTAARVGARSPEFLAWGAALLWAVHPLQTESVTYTVQRAESLMGLFYLLTLYGFIRHVGAAGKDWRWAWLTFFACLLGMGTKEVMVSAPVLVLAYDRTFVGGSFRAAWSRSWRLYLALAATWIPLAACVLSTGGNRGGTSGFGLSVSWGGYLLTQFSAVIHYIRLALWPHPLVFYYTVDWIGLGQAAPSAVALLALAVACGVAFVRRSAWGFLGVFFFAILAPTSLIPGMSQTLAEHRMYLALAPIAVALVAVLEGMASDQARLKFTLAALVALAFAGLTARRNHVYRSEVALWGDTVAKAPGNPYSQNNLGIALVDAGDVPEAIAHFHRALELNPGYAEAYDNLGLALAATGRFAAAIERYRQALGLKADYPEARANLGVALADAGRLDEAIAELGRAVALAPGYATAQNDLAVALAKAGQLADAVPHYEAALRLVPATAEMHYNLANALAGLDRWPEAVSQYEQAVQLRPAYVEASANLGVALARTGRLTEAVVAYEQALRLAPADPDVEDNLGLALRALGRTAEAESHFAIARRLRSGR